MVRTSRESFLKVQEVETDLDAISLIGETGMSSAQVRDAVVKMGGVTSSAAQIDNTVSKFVEIKVMTAAEYALITPVSTVLYFITDL